MNKFFLSLVFFSCSIFMNICFAQSYGCDGEFISAGLYSSLCEHPNGGEITLSGSTSGNVIGWVWSDENGEIARDNLVVENYFLSETTTITLSGIVISDNQIVDGEFGSGDDFADGFPSNYQGSFYTDYVQGPFQDFPPPPPPDPDNPEPVRGDADYVSPLEDDGSYMITDNAFNGGFGFTDCLDPDGFGNIAVFNLGADRNKIICTKVQLTAGNEYSFSVQVATVGEVTYQDLGGDPVDGPPDPGDIANDPMGDADGDGFPNAQDCCPFVPSPAADDCSVCMSMGEQDSDGDGIPDDRDNCPYVANPTQDPAACSTEDRDGDGVLDWQDNCPEVSNPGQEDRDGNGIGDACDEDAGGGGDGGLGGGDFGDYCIPYLELEIQGVNNQNTVIGERHISELEFCVWTDMVRTFTANVTGEVEICLMSACPFAGGNLLALDNLQFSETCRFSDDVTIYVDNISANILPVEPLDCNTEGVLLEGEWDAIYEDINNIEFFWFEAEQSVLIEGAVDEEYYVEEPGTYNFSVLNQESGCYAVFPMEVEDNFSTPEATIELPDTLSCANESIILDASASSGGADDGSYTYEWNGVFGAAFANGDPEPNSPFQEVTGSGTYELLITNTFNGCTSETFVFVEENLQAVVLNTAQESFELGCDTKSVEFNATADVDPETDPNDLQYTWTLGTEIISTSSTFEPLEVNESGEYNLTVVNTSSGCSDELNFSVTGEVSGPEVIVPPVTELISCNNTTVDISANIDGNPDVSYTWTNSAGVNLSPNGELTLSIDTPDTYTFTAIDNVSGCEAVEEVVVEGDSEEPEFSIDIPSSFDCRTSEMILEGLPTDQMGNYSYTWTDANNQTLGNSLTQEIIEAGTYTLAIVDLDNGCDREVSINVFDVTAEPQVSISQDQILNCNNSTAQVILGTSEDNLTYEWSSSNGNITNENQNIIMVDQAGTYTVTVTDEDTGCTTMEELELTTDFTAPSFEASEPNDINCETAVSTLLVNDFGAGYTYAWTTQNGSILGAANTNSPTFDLQGEYLLTVTNPTSGCAVEQSFSVVGNSLEPEIEISGGGQLGCTDQNLPISVSLTNTVPNISIQWTSINGGAFDSSTNSSSALASAAGTYEVVVTNSDNGCTAIASIEVTQDNDRPDINLSQPPNLDCNNALVTLNATGSDSGGNLQISWTAQNGSSITNAGSLVPQITQPDTYTLTIFNPDNGCETTASVTIEENLDLPFVNPPSAVELSCDNPTFVLDIGQSSSGTEYQYQWFDQNQNLINTTSSTTLEVIEAGVYTLEVTNTLTGCKDDAQINVTGNADIPDVFAGEATQLDCNTTSIFLSGTATENSEYQWTTNNGVIDNGANTLQPEVSAPGTYTLTATVASTGCEASSSVTVEADVNSPDVNVEEPGILSCTNEEIILNGNQSSSTGVDVQWTSIDNNPIQNANTLSPTISQAGEYILTITDQSSGCDNSTQITVEEDFSQPVVNLAEEVMLDCASPNMIIGDVNNPDYTYTWTSMTTQIQGDNTNAQIEISEAGTYELSVVNTTNGCVANYSVGAEGEFEATEILSLTAAEIDCNNQIITPILDIDTDLTGVSLNWTTNNGTIAAGANTAAPEFMSQGIYSVEITNLESGCVSNAEVEVFENVDQPQFDLGDSQILDCAQSTALIGISTTSQDPNFEYVWKDDQGMELSSDPQLEVENPGLYSLEILNTENGCSSTDQIQIEENISTPVVDVIDNQTFRCGDSELTLTGSLISNIGNYDITWETPNGNIQSGSNTFNPIITQPGEYTMLITNLDNQCEASASVQVTPDTDAPVAIIDPAEDLTCNVSSVILNGSNSTSNGQLSYTWSLGGVEISSDVAQIEVSDPGQYDLVVVDLDNNCSTTTSAFIELNNTAPDIEILTPSELNCDITEVTLESAFDPDGTYEFNWTTINGNIINGEDEFSTVVDQAGEYTLSVEDLTTGCTFEGSVMVNQNGDVPTFDLLASGELNCDNSEINISADLPSGNFDLIWTNLDNGQIITNPTSDLLVDEPGSYQLEIIDQDNMCTGSSSLEVIENNVAAELDALQPLSISCDNLSTQVNAEILNDLSDVIISWSTIDGEIETTNLNTLDISVLSGGNYTIEVTNLENGCVASLDILVPENGETPSFEFEEVEMITCETTEVNIQIEGLLSAANQSILWTTLNGNILGANDTDQITVDIEGTYTIRVENSDSGCFEEKSIVVEEDKDDPILSSSDPAELNCTVLEVGLEVIISNVQNIDVQWSTLNGALVGAVNNANVTANEPGEYLVNVTNVDNGCVSELTIPVSQNITVPSISVEDAEMITCKNEEVSLQGSGSTGLNISTVWSDTNGGIITDTQSESVIVNLPGVYTFTVVDFDNTCTNSAEVTVFENADIPTDFTAVVSEPLCFGDLGSVNIVAVEGGTGPYAYSLEGATFDPNSDFDQLEPGTYNIAVMDTEECTYEAAVIIPATPELQVSTQPDVELLVGQSNEIIVNANLPESEIETISWSPATYLSCDNCLNPTVTPQNDITYNITISNENGCTAMDSIVFRVQRQIDIYSPNAFSPNGDNINDSFTIYSKEGVIERISYLAVYDRWGNEVFSNSDFPVNEEEFGWNGSFRGEALQPDVYIYRALVILANGEEEELKGNVSLIK